MSRAAVPWRDVTELQLLKKQDGKEVDKLLPGEASPMNMLMSTIVIVHAFLATALIGAITHQAIGVFWPATKRTGSFVSSLRTVQTVTYTNAIIAIFLVNAALGSIVYTEYRNIIRPTLQEYHLFKPEGMMEVKEHALAIVFGLLPAYWYYYRTPLSVDSARTRAVLTGFLCVVIWFSFLTGHVLNNIRGFGS